jgi:hypothetical protein
MKKSLLLLSLFFILITTFSQDYIYLLKGKKIAAIVLEVSQEKIKYHVMDDPQGVIHEIAVSEVYMISYQNGKVDLLGSKIHGRKEKYFTYGKNQNYSLAIGGGPSYSCFGLRFQHRWGGLQGWAYHAGVGISDIICFSAGMKYFFYKGWYLDLQFGAMPVAKVNPTTVDTTFHGDINFSNLFQKTAYGIIVMIGGDWFFYRYVGLNVGMGGAFNVTKPGYSPAVFAIDLGFFCKIPDKKKKKVVFKG